ncbi:roadblock/LC7 domain-containing protein [Streptomyces olivaceus]|uniref:roadblock/LC7 domain-containing protein n=1 Tax=Streptomyces olivaceus TaxID=47716 RepID=UPI0037A12903
MTHTSDQDTAHRPTASESDQASQQMGRMLNDFVDQVPGVSHALLVGRDGLTLVSSDVHKDWADKWAATLGSLASLAENIPGPRGGNQGLKLTLIEREDALILVSIAGTSAAFPHRDGTVDTVLGVIADPGASAGTVGYEMSRLVERFAPYMVAAVRSM